MILKIFLLLCLASASLSATTTPKPIRNTPKSKCGYEACPPLKEGFVNVHIVPHTHDDVGWLKTVDQYYYGSKTSIQKAGVQYILDSVVEALGKDKNRRFIYVETAFFWKWWMKQHDFVKAAVRKLVQNGQLEFVGGAWSMNDEATTHYQSIIDQFTWGLRKLNETFGECGRPRVAWQIDPFGHSREMATLLAEMGYDGLLLGRIDYQDKAVRFRSKTPEMIWKSSDSLNTTLLTSVLFNNYAPPPGFCFDVLCDDEPIIDDVKSPDYNLDIKLSNFIDYVSAQSKIYQTKNIIVTMGGDFTYMDANMWYTNLDKLIRNGNMQLQNKGAKYNLFYSTPSCYMKAVKDEVMAKGIKLPTKQDDFFPYSSDPHAYWTGYFTSRPTLKRFERVGNNFLQVCKQLYSLTDLGPEDWVDLNALREAMGIMQHHDAVSGTEKQHVANDYARILHKGIVECDIISSTALRKLVSKSATTKPSPLPEIDFDSCLLTNISQCAITEKSKSFVITVYNPLSRTERQYVRVPVTGKSYSVKGLDGSDVVTQLVPIHPSILNAPGRQSDAKYDLVFLTDDLPPLGFLSYHVTKTKGDDVARPLQARHMKSVAAGIGVEVDRVTGFVSHIIMGNTKIPLTQEFAYYKGAVGDNRAFQNRSSGAYIFRPNGTVAYPAALIATNKLYTGQVVSEMHQTFNPWVSQIVRLYNNEQFVEFDWIVGPLLDNDTGIEVISRFTSEFKSDFTFYTDSNGREMLKRMRNFRPTWKLQVSEPVSSNYYPVTSKIMIRDSHKNMELAILTDRAQGGSSLRDGQIELMVHRSCVHDDGFGVDESLRESAFGKGLVARGSHYLVVGPYQDLSNNIDAYEKLLAQKKILQPWTFITPTDLSFNDYKAKYKMMFSGLSADLPMNVQILTLEPWKGMSYLIRFEHIMDKDTNNYNKPAKINLKGLFTSFQITSVQEVSLGANQFKSSGLDSPIEDLNDDYTIDIYPRQIRSFVIGIH